jgi:hypothetical protein
MVAAVAVATVVNWPEQVPMSNCDGLQTWISILLPGLSEAPPTPSVVDSLSWSADIPGEASNGAVR